MHDCELWISIIELRISMMQLWVSIFAFGYPLLIYGYLKSNYGSPQLMIWMCMRAYMLLPFHCRPIFLGFGCTWHTSFAKISLWIRIKRNFQHSKFWLKIVCDIRPWPECIFRNLLQFLVSYVLMVTFKLYFAHGWKGLVLVVGSSSNNMGPTEPVIHSQPHLSRRCPNIHQLPLGHIQMWLCHMRWFNAIFAMMLWDIPHCVHHNN